MEKLDEHYVFNVGREKHTIVLTTERLFLFFKRRRVYYGTPKRKTTGSWRWVCIENGDEHSVSRWAQNSLSYCILNRACETRPEAQLLLAETISRLIGVRNE